MLFCKNIFIHLYKLNNTFYMIDLKKKIKKSGRTIKWVSEKTGIPYATLISYLNGTRKPKKDIESIIKEIL